MVVRNFLYAFQSAQIALPTRMSQTCMLIMSRKHKLEQTISTSWWMQSTEMSIEKGMLKAKVSFTIPVDLRSVVAT